MIPAKRKNRSPPNAVREAQPLLDTVAARNRGGGACGCLACGSEMAGRTGGTTLALLPGTTGHPGTGTLSRCAGAQARCVAAFQGAGAMSPGGTVAGKF